jgi:hypothetical protein
MALMGGNITLSSDGEGHGTQVEISLPTIERSLLFSGESQISNDVARMSGAADNNA